MVLKVVRNMFILWTLVFSSCQGPEAPVADSSPPAFLWDDLARPVSFPGPLVDSDSLYDQKSLRIVANLAHHEWDSIASVANDSLFAAVAETPDASQLQGMNQLQAWRSTLGELDYEAFNVRGTYNKGSQSHVAYVFGRWRSRQAGQFDVFIVFTVAWNREGRLTGIAKFQTGWPRTNARPIKPTRRPEGFHFYSATRLGSEQSARKAMDFTEAIYRNNLKLQQGLLADSVEYHDGQGEYGYYSRAQVLDLLDHRTKDHVHHLVRYTSVVPWSMLRYGRDMAVVVTYEDWQNRDGSSTVYSFCRMYFFDEQGKIYNFVFTRRRVHPVGRYPLVD
jgi:hypothetical protein